MKNWIIGIGIIILLVYLVLNMLSVSCSVISQTRGAQHFYFWQVADSVNSYYIDHYKLPPDLKILVDNKDLDENDARDLFYSKRHSDNQLLIYSIVNDTTFYIDSRGLDGVYDKEGPILSFLSSDIKAKGDYRETYVVGKGNYTVIQSSWDSPTTYK